MKVVIAIAFVLIIAALAFAGASMLRRGGAARPGAMMRALAWRVALSVLLFVFLLVSYKLGWIRPTGVPLGG